MSEFSDESVLVVGANGGLATETVKFLVDDGFGRVVMAGRSAQRVEEARGEVIRTTRRGSSAAIDAVGGFDMTDPDAIAAAVDELPDEPFDVVFLAAGGVVFADEVQTVTWNGFQIERTIFQNVFGAHVTLSNLLRRGLVTPQGRVVYAGGEGARGIPGFIAKPEIASAAELRRAIQAESTSAKYNPINAIGVSKLVGAIWTSTVADLHGDEATVVWFSPGLTANTAGLQGAGRVRQFFGEKVAFPLMKLLGRAQDAVAGARKNADCLEGKVGDNGDVIGAPQGSALGDLVDQKPMHPAFTDPAMSDELWELLTKIFGPFGR